MSYDHLKPHISKLLSKISEATAGFVKESPELSPNDVFVVLYETSLATAAQIIASAFVHNPNIVQVDMYNQAMNSLKKHTDVYHKLFLNQKEQENGK